MSISLNSNRLPNKDQTRGKLFIYKAKQQMKLTANLKIIFPEERGVGAKKGASEAPKYLLNWQDPEMVKFNYLVQNSFPLQ